MIQLTNINRLHSDLHDLLYVAQEEVLASGQVMLGKFTVQLEERIAELSDAKYCSILGSGSDALMYGLMATKIRQVVVPAQTFIATKNSCTRVNIPIVYNDVDEKGCIDWNTIQRKDAIWVGLFGNDTVIPDNVNDTKMEHNILDYLLKEYLLVIVLILPNLYLTMAMGVV